MTVPLKRAGVPIPESPPVTAMPPGIGGLHPVATIAVVASLLLAQGSLNQHIRLWDGDFRADEFKSQLPDKDPQETEEWLKSLESVIHVDGPDRTRCLVGEAGALGIFCSNAF